MPIELAQTPAMAEAASPRSSSLAREARRSLFQAAQGKTRLSDQELWGPSTSQPGMNSDWATWKIQLPW